MKPKPVRVTHTRPQRADDLPLGSRTVNGKVARVDADGTKVAAAEHATDTEWQKAHNISGVLSRFRLLLLFCHPNQCRQVNISLFR